ncbi:GNAT family N-acetyltransferase [Actinoallomurus sp. NBC_01490]|uniref:GNAT family N-acetyltransferase n=1 Tax=Actinoallomurus sp. NBC_01490 TaxID=2903557 RepID=UPI002E33454B|nr:GNAT family protein [Actinoallomurus sp. NBC_01490]
MRLLVGERISLWPVAAEDGEEFVALARDSANMHRGLIFAPTEATEFAEYLDRFDGVNAVGFVVRVNATRQLAGLVNINQIERKAPDPRGSLGYGGFAATSGHGYVAEAVRLAVPYAFEELGLSRLDAYIQPANAPSRRVVEEAGFRPVSWDRKIIHVGGKSREHERWTRTNGNGGS